MIRYLNTGEINSLRRNYYKLLYLKKVILSEKKIRRFFSSSSSDRELIDVYYLLSAVESDLCDNYIKSLGGDLSRLNQYMLSELHRRKLISEKTFSNIKKLTVDRRYIESTETELSLEEIVEEKSEELELKEKLDLWEQYHQGLKIFLDILSDRNILYEELDTFEIALYGDCRGFENFRSFYDNLEIDRDTFFEEDDPLTAIRECYNEGGTTFFIDCKINDIYMMRTTSKLEMLESNGIANEIYSTNDYTYLTISDSAQLGLLDVEPLLHLIISVLEVN